MALLMPIVISVFLIHRQNIREIYWLSDSYKKDIVHVMKIAGVYITFTLFVCIILFLHEEYNTPSNGIDSSREVQSVSEKHIMNLSLNGLILLIVQTCFASPAAEEVFWRGYVFQYLFKKSNVISACILQALMFSLYHYKRSLFDAVWLFIAGVVYGYSFYSRKNVVAPTILHILYNLGVFVTHLLPIKLTSE